MKRLIEGPGKNSPSEYDRIFKERQQKGVHWFDIKRWQYLIKEFRGGYLLDSGCLDSLVPLFARKKCPDSTIWGIDIAKEALDSMKHSMPWVDYSIQNVYKIQFYDGSFDYVVAGELIEHLETPQLFLKEAFRVLKKGGTLALSTPLEEEKEIGACDKDRHIWSFSKQDIIDLLSSYGEVKIRIVGSQWFPKYKYHPKCIIAFCKKQ